MRKISVSQQILFGICRPTQLNIGIAVMLDSIDESTELVYMLKAKTEPSLSDIMNRIVMVRKLWQNMNGANYEKYEVVNSSSYQKLMK